MSSKPKLLFVYDHKYPDKWMDGLWAALNLLEEDFEIKRTNLQEPEILTPNYDFILGWGGFQSRVDQYIQVNLNYYSTAKKGLCIGGNAFPAHAGYDVLFYETKWVRDNLQLNMVCDNLVHAFGINSDIYNKIDIPTPIVWDYIGVGSLSYWKRWELMKNKKGNKLVIGEYQKDNEIESSRIATDLLRGGVMVQDAVSPFDLANYYHWSRTLYIPAEVNGGGERAILEARACGLPVEIEEDNPKLKELLDCEVWDHKYYAKKLKEGILNVL